MARLPGPRPQPTELKVLRGNPGQRRLPNSPRGTKPVAIPPAPAGLGEVGAAAWTLYWTAGKPWLAVSDMPHVERLCRFMDMAADIEATMRTEGLTHRTRQRRSAPHQLLTALLNINKVISDLEATSGFTPSDRVRMKAAPEEPGELDRWMTGTK